MERIKLGDICKPSVGKINEDEDTLIDYIDISSVDNETKKVTGYQTITFGDSPSRARKAVRRGNVLVSTVRPNLNAVALLEEDTPNVSVASTGFCVLESKDDVDPRFIFNFCKSKPFIDDMVSQATGASYPAVSDKIVRSALVPMYSYQEQQHISNVLDKLAKIIDSRRTELQELEKLIKARFVELFGNPIKNEKGLPTVLGETLFKLSNGKFLPDSKRFSEGIPAYGGNGISWYTDEILCDVDTIIVGRVGFQSGNVHLAKAPLWVTDNAMYISSINSHDCDIRFLCALMEHIDFTRYQDAGDLKKITQKPFMQMHYLMPPLSLQMQYITFVEQVNKSKFDGMVWQRCFFSGGMKPAGGNNPCGTEKQDRDETGRRK